MPEGKNKFINDAIRIIEGRVAALKEELEREMQRDPDARFLSGDRAAIAEAEHLARMIRTLTIRPYRGDPYEVAQKRWEKGEV